MNGSTKGNLTINFKEEVVEDEENSDLSMTFKQTPLNLNNQQQQQKKNKVNSPPIEVLNFEDNTDEDDVIIEVNHNLKNETFKRQEVIKPFKKDNNENNFSLKVEDETDKDQSKDKSILDTNSIGETISVGGIDNFLPVNHNSSSSSDSILSNPINFTEQSVDVSPFTHREKMLLLKKVLKLSIEEFIRVYVYQKQIPVISLLSLFDVRIPKAFFQYDNMDLVPILKTVMFQSTQVRPKLEHLNTIEDVVELIRKSKKIMVLSGAGVSVSCGIPDFRSENGIYSRLEEFNLSDPQQMFCLDHFQFDPQCFFTFAKEIYPSNFQPSSSHNFIKLLESKGKLLRNYTQNIDTLEQKAGIKKVIQCHGSFATCSCIRCGARFDGKFIEKNIFNQEIPYCPKCPHLNDTNSSIEGIIKPDIVFFGEGLPTQYDQCLIKDRSQVDLLLVLGTSLKVRPVAEIVNILPKHVPQILINRTPNTSIDFDIQLLGYSDYIIELLVKKLNWNLNKDEEEDKNSEKGKNDGKNEKVEEELIDWSVHSTPNHWHIFQGALPLDLITNERTDSDYTPSSCTPTDQDLDSKSPITQNLLDDGTLSPLTEPSSPLLLTKRKRIEQNDEEEKIKKSQRIQLWHNEEDEEENCSIISDP